MGMWLVLSTQGGGDAGSALGNGFMWSVEFDDIQLI